MRRRKALEFLLQAAIMWRKASPSRHFHSETLSSQCACLKQNTGRVSKNIWAAARLISEGLKSQAQPYSVLQRTLHYLWNTHTHTHTHAHTLSLSRSVLLSACRSNVSITFGIISCCLQAHCTSFCQLRQHRLQCIPVLNARFVAISMTGPNKEPQRSEREALWCVPGGNSITE